MFSIYFILYYTVHIYILYFSISYSLETWLAIWSRQCRRFYYRVRIRPSHPCEAGRPIGLAGTSILLYFIPEPESATPIGPCQAGRPIGLAGTSIVLYFIPEPESATHIGPDKVGRPIGSAGTSIVLFLFQSQNAPLLLVLIKLADQ